MDVTDHLPECPAPLCDWGDPSAKCMGYEDCHHLCCCAALSACEQRVRQSLLHHINQEFPKPTLGIQRVKQLLTQDTHE